MLSCGKAQCNEPAQTTIERVVTNLINRLILDGVLQQALTDCKGSGLRLHEAVVTCEGFLEKLCQAFEEGAVCVPTIESVTLEGTKLIFTFKGVGETIEVDLAELTKHVGNGVTNVELKENTLHFIRGSGDSFDIDLSKFYNSLKLTTCQGEELPLGSKVVTCEELTERLKDIKTLVNHYVDNSGNVIPDGGKVITPADLDDAIAALPKDNFLSGVSYDKKTRELTFTMKDGKTFKEKIEQLFALHFGEGLSGDGSADKPLKVTPPYKDTKGKQIPLNETVLTPDDLNDFAQNSIANIKNITYDGNERKLIFIDNSGKKHGVELPFPLVKNCAGELVSGEVRMPTCIEFDALKKDIQASASQAATTAATAAVAGTQKAVDDIRAQLKAGVSAAFIVPDSNADKHVKAVAKDAAEQEVAKGVKQVEDQLDQAIATAVQAVLAEAKAYTDAEIQKLRDELPI